MNDRAHTAVDTVASFLAAASIACAAIAVANRPVRFGIAAALLALLAGRMSGRSQHIALAAVICTVIGWTLGMALAAGTGNPLF